MWQSLCMNTKDWRWVSDPMRHRTLSHRVQATLLLRSTDYQWLWRELTAPSELDQWSCWMHQDTPAIHILNTQMYTTHNCTFHIEWRHGPNWRKTMQAVRNASTHTAFPFVLVLTSGELHLWPLPTKSNQLISRSYLILTPSWRVNYVQEFLQ